MFYVLLKGDEVVKVLSEGDKDVANLANFLISNEADEIVKIGNLSDLQQMLNSRTSPAVNDLFEQLKATGQLMVAELQAAGKVIAEEFQKIVKGPDNE